jgi:CheY-like chemotaxis protein
MEKRLPYILVADDDPDDQQLFAELFLEQNPNAKIIFVNDGQEALTYLEGCDPDGLPLLIMLDYKMPVLTGADVLIIIEKDTRYQHIPKIVWSTSNRPEYAGRCFQHGAEQYFTKPNDMGEMEKIIGYLSRLFRSRHSV